jgi:hypothetical protein
MRNSGFHDWLQRRKMGGRQKGRRRSERPCTHSLPNVFSSKYSACHWDILWCIVFWVPAHFSRSEMTGYLVLVFSLFRNCQTIFHGSHTILPSHQQCVSTFVSFSLWKLTLALPCIIKALIRPWQYSFLYVCVWACVCVFKKNLSILTATCHVAMSQ